MPRKGGGNSRATAHASRIRDDDPSFATEACLMHFCAAVDQRHGLASMAAAAGRDRSARSERRACRPHLALALRSLVPLAAHAPSLSPQTPDLIRAAGRVLPPPRRARAVARVACRAIHRYAF